MCFDILTKQKKYTLRLYTHIHTHTHTSLLYPVDCTHPLTLIHSHTWLFCINNRLELNVNTGCQFCWAWKETARAWLNNEWGKASWFSTRVIWMLHVPVNLDPEIWSKSWKRHHAGEHHWRKYHTLKLLLFFSYTMKHRETNLSPSKTSWNKIMYLI